jgi:hypothetical protein
MAISYQVLRLYYLRVRLMRKRASLAAWKARVGPKQADEIRDKAAERGTAMHTYLEHHISRFRAQGPNGCRATCREDGKKLL